MRIKVLATVLVLIGLAAIVFFSIQRGPKPSPGNHPMQVASGTGDALQALAWILVLAVGGVVYFIPTIVANKRQHNNATAISVLNIFLGWSVLGWIISLVWACTADVRKAADGEQSA